MATKYDPKEQLGYLLVETAPEPVDQLPALMMEGSQGCSICRRAGSSVNLVETDPVPADGLPALSMEGSQGCSICKSVTASYDEGERHIHVEAQPDFRLPTDLDVDVVVTGEGGVHRHFAPPPEALLALERYRSVDWYLPVPIPGLTRVVLAVSYKEEGLLHAGETVAAMR